MSGSLLEGDEESRRRARLELARAQRLHVAETSKLPRLDLDELEFHRFGVVVHVPSGDRYKVSHGEHVEAQHSPATAWYLDRDEPVFLEPVK